jgi:hypothetical protein
MLATVTQSPEFVLADQEARQIAEAAARVGKHYDLTASAKAVDWAGLVMACAAVYGPRIAVVRHRKMYEAAQARQQQGGAVVVHPDFGTS